jgi:hypothetical protein
MDTFKIISIIFMMIVIYQIYQLNCTVYKDNREDFADVPAQSLGGVDDTNAINTLAQIAKNLMAGGVTVPGNMNIQGGILDIKAPGDWGFNASFTGGNKEAPYINFVNKADGKRNGFIMGAPDKFILSNNVDVGGGLTVNGVLNPAVGVWHTSTDGKHRIHYGNNSHSYYKTNDAHVWRNRDDTDRMDLDHGANLRVDGALTVSGRNILAELDALKNSVTKPIVVTSRWDDGAFMAVMAGHFNRNEPDGTKKDFLIKNESGDNWRWQTGIKMYGNQVWAYPQWLRNNGDCSGCANNPANGNDAFRVNI